MGGRVFLLHLHNGQEFAKDTEKAAGCARLEAEEHQHCADTGVGAVRGGLERVAPVWIPGGRPRAPASLSAGSHRPRAATPP